MQPLMQTLEFLDLATVEVGSVPEQLFDMREIRGSQRLPSASLPLRGSVGLSQLRAPRGVIGEDHTWEPLQAAWAQVRVADRELSHPRSPPPETIHGALFSCVSRNLRGIVEYENGTDASERPRRYAGRNRSESCK